MQNVKKSRAPRPAADEPVNPGPGRPKDLEKRAAILEAGKRLFPRLGFDGTSMDAVAAEAGVSKLTVYNHFRDKDTLFQEVCRAKCEQQLPQAIFAINPRWPLRRQLVEIGLAFFGLIMSDEAIALHRMMTAQRDPKLARLFWEAGPERAKAMLRQFLQAEVAEGALDIDDVQRAGSHFFCLLKGEPYARVTYGCCESLSVTEARTHIEAVVDLFLRAYAPRVAGA